MSASLDHQMLSPPKRSLETSFLLFVFGAKENHKILKENLAQCLKQHPENRELIMELAQSLALPLKNRPCNIPILVYLKKCQLEGKRYLIDYYFTEEPICHTMNIFCEEISLFLKDAYQQLRDDDLLLVRRQLTLKGKEQSNRILCANYPDNDEYALQYVQSLAYSLQYRQGIGFIAKKIAYFQRTGQIEKAKTLKPYGYALDLFDNQYWYSFDEQMPQQMRERAVHKKLILFSLNNCFKFNCFRFLMNKYRYLNGLLSQDLLSLDFIDSIYLSGPPSPEQYRKQLASLHQNSEYYNLAMFIRFYEECLYDESEHYLQKELTLNSNQFYMKYQKMLFYLKLGKYQKSLDSGLKLLPYTRTPIKSNILYAFCYIMLDQPEKARPMARDIDQSRNSDLKLLVIYSKLGWTERVASLSEKLKKSLKNNTELLGVLVLAMISRQNYGIREIIGRMDEIQNICQNLYPVMLKFRKHFSIYFFLCQFCFSSKYPDLYKKGRFFAQKAHQVIEGLRKYSEKGADHLRSAFKEKKSVNIWHQLFI